MFIWAPAFIQLSVAPKHGEQNDTLILFADQGTRSNYEDTYKDKSTQVFQNTTFLFVAQFIEKERCLCYDEYLFIPTSDGY